MKYKTLHNGIEIPVVGSGTNTFGKEDNQYHGALTGSTQEVDWAIENGYRHFDCAQSYLNEEIIGNGLKKSSLPREDFFITTKLHTSNVYKGANWAHAEIEKSLKKLQTDYIDLFLIHWPWDNRDEMVEAWAILEDYYTRGAFRSIGVSNFEQEHLGLILEHSSVKPAVNQIGSHVSKWNDELIAYNHSHKIATVAYSPLGGIHENARHILDEIGSQYGKTYAQVVLRYQIERDVIVIPKSHNKERQAQNVDIFDFVLTETDRERIAAL